MPLTEFGDLGFVSEFYYCEKYFSAILKTIFVGLREEILLLLENIWSQHLLFLRKHFILFHFYYFKI